VKREDTSLGNENGGHASDIVCQLPAASCQLPAASCRALERLRKRFSIWHLVPFGKWCKVFSLKNNYNEGAKRGPQATA